MTDEEERRLVEAAQQDPSRFGDLYDRHFTRVYAFVVSRVRDRASAEDLTADVFHRALANLPRFEWRGAPFGAWLIRIAANAIADRFTTAGREVSADGGMPDAAVAPDVDRFETRARLFELVERLPGAQREVILERFVEGRSIREIAARLDRSEGAIKQLQFRALQTLRSQMEGADV
jgi:RNA polymerase sigma-70 factor (ECF subfamily)